jgi:hypothetical protein
LEVVAAMSLEKIALAALAYHTVWKKDEDAHLKFNQMIEAIETYITDEETLGERLKRFGFEEPSEEQKEANLQWNLFCLDLDKTRDGE